MSIKPNIRKQKVFATVEEFEKWLTKKKTDYNYEFVNGLAIKKQPMKQIELYIITFLTDLFMMTEAFTKKGRLVPEIDVYIDEYRKRVPDLAYFTAEQIKETRKGIKVVPTFVIELLSDSESYDSVEDKINDYFRAGVQVVWYLNPKKQTIHLYLSAKEIKVLSGDDICSASPVVPDYRFMVKEIFEV
jgi:Uma2 family endonuclease